jgi:hypothetical protein
MEIIGSQLLDLRRNGINWSEAPEQAIFNEIIKPNILSRNEVLFIY